MQNLYHGADSRPEPHPGFSVTTSEEIARSYGEIVYEVELEAAEHEIADYEDTVAILAADGYDEQLLSPAGIAEVVSGFGAQRVLRAEGIIAIVIPDESPISGPHEAMIILDPSRVTVHGK